MASPRAPIESVISKITEGPQHPPRRPTQRAMRRSLTLLSRHTRLQQRRPQKAMAVVRLDHVLFPDSMSTPLQESALPADVEPSSIAAFGPGARVGVEVDLVLDVEEPSAKLLVGGRRVRLLRERPSHDRTSTVAVLQHVEDIEVSSAARAERIADEANRARDLACLATERNQLRSPAVPATEVLDAANLSLWLAARLPLTARLQADLLATTCPLRRIQDVVDAMRLLTESTPRRKRTGHRFRLLEADEEDESLFVVDKSNDRLAAPM